jgi:hypothetical protein
MNDDKKNSHFSSLLFQNNMNGEYIFIFNQYFELVKQRREVCQEKNK